MKRSDPGRHWELLAVEPPPHPAPRVWSASPLLWALLAAASLLFLYLQ